MAEIECRPADRPAGADGARTEPARDSWTGVLRELGVVGYDRLEPVIVAALAEEAPLLLIGAHGTAKSLLLNRIAGALGLVHRHYNASLLNFDDLIGFPYPSADRRELEYIQTPATIWPAESVFFDEVSRCRPEMQNKLFPLIYERCVLGVPLERLRFRWAAMNPPGGFDGAGDLDAYTGSEPLDPALADRFAYVVAVPGFADLSPEDQGLVLSGVGERVSDRAGERLRVVLARTRELIPVVAAWLDAGGATYVQALLPRLDALRLRISPRRGRQLVRNIVAVHAARLALRDPEQGADGSAFLALQHSLPHPAYGRAVDPGALLTAHRAAWDLVRLDPDDPARVVLAERDPVLRLVRAVAVGLDPLELSAMLTDTLAGLAVWQRHVLAAILYPVLADTVPLSATALDALAELAALAYVNEPAIAFTVPSKTPRHAQWHATQKALAQLPESEPGGAVLHNLLVRMVAEKVEFEPERAIAWWRELVLRVGVAPGKPPARAAA